MNEERKAKLRQLIEVYESAATGRLDLPEFSSAHDALYEELGPDIVAFEDQVYLALEKEWTGEERVVLSGHFTTL